MSMRYRCSVDAVTMNVDVRSICGSMLRNAEPPPPQPPYHPYAVGRPYRHARVYVYIYIGGRGGESACDPNREIDFGFVFVHVSCVRAKLCAMIPLWLGAAKLFSPPAAAAPPVGGRTSRDVPRDVPPGRRAGRRSGRRAGRLAGRRAGRPAGRRCGVSWDVVRDVPCGVSRDVPCKKKSACGAPM